MTWTAYKLVYQVQSPICIGHHALGFITRTRYYIPARNIWAALVANLTRHLGSQTNGADGKLYQDIGNKINKHMRFSYFYPRYNGKALLPKYDKELRIGDHTLHKFESMFIRSMVKTSIAPDSFSALDESLFEIEYISQYPEVTNNGKFEPLKFVGYVFIKDGTLTINNDETLDWDPGDFHVKNIINKITVGAELKYGFGRLKLFKSEEVINEATIFDRYKVNLDKPEPIIEILEDAPIPAHLDIKDTPDNVEISGDYEPIVSSGWHGTKDKKDWRKGLKHLGDFWMPGTTIKNDGSEKRVLHLKENGYLEWSDK